MRKIDLNEIISLYEKIDTTYSFTINENLEILQEICNLIGSELEDYNKETIDIHKFFIDKISEITKEIVKNLDYDEKDIFFNSIPVVIKISILEDEEKVEILDIRQEELSEYDISLIAKSLNYDDEEKIKILDSVFNTEFKIEIICTLKSDEQKINILESFDLSDIYIVKIIKTMTSDENKIKSLKYLEDEEKRTIIISSLKSDDKKIELLEKIEDEGNRAQIIKSLQDDDKKIELLEKIEQEKNRVQIIKSLQDDDKKIAQLEYMEEQPFIVQIVESIQNDEKKIGCLDKIDSEDNREKIIKTLKNDEYKKEALKYLRSEEYITRVIKSLQSDDDKILYLKNLRTSFYILQIIKSLKDDDKKIEQLKNIEKESIKIEIIKSLQDDDRKIEFLQNFDDESRKVEIIISLQDDSKKIEQLENIRDEDNRRRIIESLQSIDEKIKALAHVKDEKTKLRIIGKINNDRKRIFALRNIDEKYIELYNLIYGNGESSLTNNKYSSLNLPPNMTIGIEIEAEGEWCDILPKEIDGWREKFEYSIGNKGIGGREYVSPIMKDNEKNVRAIYKINRILQVSGMRTTPKCGGHVHIGADYIKCEEGFKELVELWGNAEDVYFLISNKAGELPREGVRKYAEPISDVFERANMGNVPKDRFIINAKQIMLYNRYKSLNLLNVNNSMNTIEFRLANGTLDGDTWIENIRLFGRTVQIAQELGEISVKLERGEQLTEEEKTKYALKEMLKDDVSQDMKMDILMRILFSEEEQEVYYERYRANQKLKKEQHVVPRLKFGKVDFKKVYEGIEIPEGLIEEIQKGKTKRESGEIR